MIRNTSILLTIFALGFILACCSNEKPFYDVKFIKTFTMEFPDSAWIGIRPEILHYYYGELPTDSFDFQAYFKIVRNDDYLFIFVNVIDQIKYTHPKPQNELDKSLWNLSDYDRVNLMFDSNNDAKIETNSNDIGISMNYGVDSIFSTNISPKDVIAKQKDTDLGYIMEFKIPIRYFRINKIAFNIVITDHDKKFHENDYDVYGRWESEFGWGVNDYMEDLNKRYGFLKFN